MTSFSRQSLLRAVQLAASVTLKNTPKACLKGILVKVNKDKCTITSTDLENTITIEVECDGKDSFEALPDARKFLDILSNIGDVQFVNLGKTDDALNISTDFSDFDLKDCDATDTYPTSVETEPDVSFTIEATTLIPSLKRTCPFFADESARYAIKGIKFEMHEGKLILVATDGKRLAVERLPVPGMEASNETYVVPDKAIRLFSSAAKNNGEAFIGFTKNIFTAKLGDIAISAKMVEGRYPTWQDVLPKKIEHKLPLNVGAFLSMTRQACCMVTEETRAVQYAISNGVMTAKAQDSIAGKAFIKMPIAYYGESFAFNLDGHIVREMLNVWTPDDELTLLVPKKLEVVEFRFGESYQHVIVPIQVGQAKEAA